jgi:hypothetical protein
MLVETRKNGNIAPKAFTRSPICSFRDLIAIIAPVNRGYPGSPLEGFAESLIFP